MKNVKNVLTQQYRFSLFVILILFVSTTTYADVVTGAVVKLYSKGKIVNVWKAKRGGRIVGQCYVFESDSKLNEKTITVCGTFSVEEKK